ncbi:MAG TPA: four helix bundle protein [Polyangiaceae bacterium]|nr:four helix bundle protein [Polyangiaceae bacterium]
MLKIYDDMLVAVRLLRGVVAAIEKRDADLARQLKRAGSSVVLNLAEGSGSAGGIRRARYRTALGSARETLACLETAEAWGYVRTLPDGLIACMNRVVGTLVRIAA